MMNYDATCAAATTRQGLDPVVARLTAEGIDHAVEQTGGFCMVVVARPAGPDGPAVPVASDGMDADHPYGSSVYPPGMWEEGCYEDATHYLDADLDGLVRIIRDAGRNRP